MSSPALGPTQSPIQ